MRNKDENKKDAIFAATIHLINEIGYANASMSKIAKVAGVSASTLYTYYENKEDMFQKVYVEAKTQMLSACSNGIDPNETVKQSIRRICKNLLGFMEEHKEYFLFIEQSSTSPLVTSAVYEEVIIYQKPVLSVFERGINEDILKKTSPILLIGFCFYPIQQIYKDTCLRQAMIEPADYDLIFDMCWDAIKN